MSKLNPTSGKSENSQERLAGGKGPIAAKQSNISALRRMVLANLLWEDLAYVDGVTVASQISKLIPLCDAADVANLAIEARLSQKLRHTPLFIASEMCRYPDHRKFVSTVLPVIITRPDMITDFLSIYWKGGKRPIANQAKKGLAEAFHNFDEYQFAKYDRDGAIKLRDVMFLVHPEPLNDAEAELFKKISDRNLKTPYTWEVELSTNKDKEQAWTDLIKSKKLGALAVLRNIRNMEQAGVDPFLIKEAIKNINGHMLLPLDFWKAATSNRNYYGVIEEVMLKSYRNLPKLKGNTLFIVDVSGSMNARISAKSNFTRMDVACVMAMLASNQCEKFKLVATAGNDSSYNCMSKEIKSPEKGFGIVEQILDAAGKLGGGGIFTAQCIEICRKLFVNEKFDRIIIFSDSQDCDRGNRTIRPFGTHNYICDVSAHEKGINFKGVWDAEISGWSEHFLTYISALEGVNVSFETEK